MDRNPPLNTSWVVVTFKTPVQWTRADEEIWPFNPHHRYILNWNQLESLKPHILTVSDLKNAGYYRQLDGNTRLHDAHLLIERYRDRGIGDLLFLTGPMQYLYDLSGSTATIDIYSLLDRGGVLRHNPALKYGPLMGPISYDDLPQYTAHWFVDSVTEHVEEPDQLNVYDALYRQIGINPTNVHARYKRPTLTLVASDFRDLDSVYATCYAKQKVDLRVTPYIVLCPCAYSSLRTAPYNMWLNLARKLAEKYTVIFIGRTSDQGQMPMPDMTFGEFYQHVDGLSKQAPQRIINLMGPTPLRPIMAMVGRATGVISMDSGMLYVAQALRVPAVSIWGPQPPHTRLNYDPAYMRGAIWNRQDCANSPCFAYQGFPVAKCPLGELQRACQVLVTVTVEQVMEKLEVVLADVEGARPPPPMAANVTETK